MYFSIKSQKMETRFLGLVELKSVDASGIFEKLDGLMTKYNLCYTKMIGYGSDGANVVSGQHNSVWTRIRDKNSSVLQFT